jgi:Conserved TM helix
MLEQISAWGAGPDNSLSHALTLFLGAIPSIIAFLVVLGVGWALATLVARGATALLRRVRFNDMAHRSGLAGVVNSTGIDSDAIGFLALSAKWFIRLIALVVAFDALGLPAVSQTLRQLVLWLPNVVVALVILVIGGLAANALHGVVRASAATAELNKPDLLASLARGAVWTFSIAVAVNQIGIASELVTTSFTAAVAGLALALGLAFGLGGRDTASEIISDLSTRGLVIAPHSSKRGAARKSNCPA